MTTPLTTFSQQAQIAYDCINQLGFYNCVDEAGVTRKTYQDIYGFALLGFGFLSASCATRSVSQFVAGSAMLTYSAISSALIFNTIVAQNPLSRR